MNFNIINTNARSLRPKISSLIDFMNELEITIAVVTETWFADGHKLEQESQDLLLGRGIGIITKNRKPVNGLSHGGVAVLSFASQTKMKEYCFPNPENFEVLIVEATVKHLPRKVYVLAAYVPPGYNVQRGRGCLEHINNAVLDIKSKVTDPYFCIAGDFNQWPVQEYLDDYPDISEIVTPPTRKDRRIDKIFLNCDTTERTCHPPLETEGEDMVRRSDHLVQFCRAELPGKAFAKWRKVTSRPFTSSGAASFKEELAAESWASVKSAAGPNAKEQAYQSVIDRLLDKHFPKKGLENKGRRPPVDRRRGTEENKEEASGF